MSPDALSSISSRSCLSCLSTSHLPHSEKVGGCFLCFPFHVICYLCQPIGDFLDCTVRTFLNKKKSMGGKKRKKKYIEKEKGKGKEKKRREWTWTDCVPLQALRPRLGHSFFKFLFLFLFLFSCSNFFFSWRQNFFCPKPHEAGLPNGVHFPCDLQSVCVEIIKC